KAADLGRMDPEQSYNRTLCAAADGWVYCAIGSEKADLVAYNPQTKARRSLIPESERRPGFGQIERGADGFAYGSCNGKSYRLRDGAATQIASLPPAMPRTRFRNGQEAIAPETYKGRELTIFRLAAGPDGKVYGSAILPEYLLRFDPAKGQPETMGLIPGAEAYSMLSAGDKLYIASYPSATLQIYDPAKPFAPGTERANNPAYYGQTAPRQDRPYDMALGADGKLYMACVPAYGYHGGALSWYDPHTDALDHAAEPVPEQAVASVCALADGRLACGTSTEGGPGTQPLAKEAVLFLWDPARQQKEFETVPLPGFSSIANLTAGGDGLVYGATGADLFVFDPQARRVLARTTLTQGAVARAGLLTLHGGRVVALAGSSALFLRYARGRWQIEEFARGDRALTAGKAVVGDWLYAAADKHLLRCRIPKR
ncbi:MAG TPA: hypothetical protein VKT32_09070, partial [Chthonomonadaceae bacterium]|nr:hypothetical protein [Chthonomonadaceae bacterium]